LTAQSGSAAEILALATAGLRARLLRQKGDTTLLNLEALDLARMQFAFCGSEFIRENRSGDKDLLILLPNRE
jgi:hypothetical protein